MRNTGIAAFIIICTIGITSHAQNATKPVFQIEERNIFDPSLPFETVLTCDWLAQNNDKGMICKKFESTDKCQEYFSEIELNVFQNTCQVDSLQQAETNTIFDNCVISKSREVNSSAMRNVRSACRRISENPTMLQRWRWGS